MGQIWGIYSLYVYTILELRFYLFGGYKTCSLATHFRKQRTNHTANKSSSQKTWYQRIMPKIKLIAWSLRSKISTWLPAPACDSGAVAEWRCLTIASGISSWADDNLLFGLPVYHIDRLNYLWGVQKLYGYDIDIHRWQRWWSEKTVITSVRKSSTGTCFGDVCKLAGWKMLVSAAFASQTYPKIMWMFLNNSNPQEEKEFFQALLEALILRSEGLPNEWVSVNSWRPWEPVGSFSGLKLQFRTQCWLITICFWLDPQ